MELINKATLMKDLFFAKTSKKHIPIVVHLNITNKCNLRCPYCYGTYSNRKGIVDITTERFYSLFDELHSMGTKRINFGAGEPLMRKDIGELIDYARNKEMICNMNTNGHLVPMKLDAVKKLNTLCISIDGDEETHDLGKGKDSYKKVIEAIKIAKKNKINVHTSTVLTKDNVHAVKSILGITKKLGVLSEWLLPFFPSTENFLADNKDYKRAIKEIIEYKKKGFPIMNSFKALEYCLNWPDYRQKSIKTDTFNPKRHIPCYASKFMCIIDSDAKVYPCSQMIDTNYPALNFLEVGFKKAWDNLKNNDCRSCYAFIAFNDYNLLINRDFNTIWNYLKNSYLEKRL